MLAVYRASWRKLKSLYVMDLSEDKTQAEVLDGPFDTIDEVIESMKGFLVLNPSLTMPEEKYLRAFAEIGYPDSLSV